MPDRHIVFEVTLGEPAEVPGTPFAYTIEAVEVE